MLLQIYRRTDEGETLVSIGDALSLQDEAYHSIDDMLVRLIEMQTAGLIRIDPSPDVMQRLAIRSSLQVYVQKDRDEHGIRRFIPDRRGGRINRTARNLIELDSVHRREALASIQRSMLVELPAAYRSQAQLLALLDPGADPELIARQVSTAAGNAVRRGMAEGRAVADQGEQAV